MVGSLLLYTKMGTPTRFVLGAVVAACLALHVAGEVDWSSYGGGAADTDGDGGGGGGGSGGGGEADEPQRCGEPPKQKTPYDDYDFENQHGDHTKMAIKMDEEGYTEQSLLAFAAAAHFDPTSASFTNYGVSLMRAGKLDASFEQMLQAHEIAYNPSDVEFVHSNIDGLKTWFAHKKLEPAQPWPLPENAGQGTLPDKPTTTARAARDADGGKKKKKSKGKSKGSAQGRKVPRPELLHQRRVPLAPPLPRVSQNDLASGDLEFEAYRSRTRPFILTGAIEEWSLLKLFAQNKSKEEWQKELVDTVGKDTVCDFYPHNMLNDGSHSPYLTRLGRALVELFIEPGPMQQRKNNIGGGSRFRFDPTAPLTGRYLHVQLTPKTWEALEQKGAMPMDLHRHEHLASDEWMEECLDYPHSAISEEFHLKNHWKIILAGARGAGMFNHSDTLLTSSWHAHLTGRKWWYVCGPKGNCFEDYLMPGEVLYYGPHWHHETQNIITPTITITDTVAFDGNYKGLALKLHHECTTSKTGMLFSAELCDALQTCFDNWEFEWGGHEDEYVSAAVAEDRYPDWRTVANDETIKRREGTKPADNNYDGRNYITE